MPQPQPVHAIIPLSLLEAIRNLDTPVEDGLDELSGEVVAKRLGLSATVGAQIGRYQGAARRGRRVDVMEVAAVFRLVSRRADAALVFADAGRRAARMAARASGLRLPGVLSVMPGPFRRGLGRSWARGAAWKVLRSDLRVRPSAVEARVETPLSVFAVPDGRACGFYGAALAELIRGLAGFEGTMIHEACRARGDDACRWRAAPAGEYE